MTQAFIDLINAYGQRWAAWMMAAAVNSVVLLALVSVVWLLLRRRVAPQVGYCLFLLVPLKLVLPIGVNVPPEIARWAPSAPVSSWFDERVEASRGSARSTVESDIAVVASSLPRGIGTDADRLLVGEAQPASNIAPAAAASSIALAGSTSGRVEGVAANVTPARITVAATVMLLWLGVVVLFFCRFVYTQFRFWIHLRRARPIADRQLNLSLRELVCQADIRRRVQFVECDDIAAPAVSGIIRPIVILPRGIAVSLTAQQLRWVLLHELAHVRRHDVLVVAVQRCIAILHFFNPTVWIANRIAYRLREYVCDDFALAISKTSAVESGQAFLEVLRNARGHRRMHGALGIFGFDSRAACMLRIERLLDGDRMIRTRVGVLSMCSVLMLAIVALPYLHAAPGIDPSQLTEVTGKSPANLTGVVKSADGKPLQDALVTIYSAGVRVGYSPFCPTCYADCGKRAVAGADGAFTIEKLDPTLVFRVLVIAKGYEPKFVTKVDPVQGKHLDVSLNARPAVPDDRTRVVAGQVFSPNNTPQAGALIEPFGCKTGTRRWWGSMPGVDPLAVSDDKGRFEIVTAESVEALDLQISARGAATKKFALVPSGNVENRLQLSAGATVRGRLLAHGKPLAGVLVGLSQADRSAEDYISAIQIGTDSEGQFMFTNVPPDREYFVYGIMRSLLNHGAVNSRSLKVAGDNSTTDAGDLSVEPAFRIAGRVALADGRPLPAHTRVLFSREDAWDSLTVQADAEGHFEAQGIPKGIISITASVPNYHMSEKNKSLERLNGTSLEGLVTADIEGLTILLDPGKHEWRDWSKSRDEWRAVVRTLDALKVEPPAGVAADLQPLVEIDPDIIEVPLTKPVKALPKIDIPAPAPALPAVDADVPQREIRGRVRDQGGKPVVGADVLMPLRWTSATNYLTARTKSAADGTFELKFPAEWISDDVTRILSTVWAYADGHSIGVGSAFKQLRYKKSGEPCDIQLGPPADTQFTVLLPDGQPAAGVRVAPQHFLASQGAYDYVPAAIVAMTSATTDREGHAALPAYPIEKMSNVNVVSDELGTQQFSQFSGQDRSNRELKLQPVGRIEGRVLADQPELFRDLLIFIETESDPTGARACTGQAMVTVSEDGRFVIPRIAAGIAEVNAQIDKRLPVRPRLPAHGQSEVFAGKTTRLEIPLEMTVKVQGVVRIKGSEEPAPGAKIYVSYGIGRQGDDATSDNEGRYTARVLPGKVSMQVISVPNISAMQMIDSRSAHYEVPEGATDFELPPIELARTTTLPGRLLDSAGKPLANRRISGIKGDGRYGFGESDENGNFQLANVPEGMALEKFEIWPADGGRRLESTIDSTDPLVIRLK